MSVANLCVFLFDRQDYILPHPLQGDQLMRDIIVDTVSVL